MSRTAYRLDPKPGNGFHLGREGLDQEVSVETFPSDSLFAALVATLATLDPDGVAAFVAPPEDEPLFRITSLFPVAGQLPLLPMPRLRANLGDELRPEVAKPLKKLAYVSPVILARLLSNAPVDAWLGPKGLMLQKGKVWIDRKEIESLPEAWRQFSDQKLHDTAIWKAQPVPRVAVDRVTNRSNIFHVGRTVFAEGCGLWMMVETQRDDDRLETLLNLLADQGIGGERSAGYGAFTLSTMSVPDLPLANGVGRVMTLSRYNPTPDELEAGVLGPDASYELVDVGGWLATPGGPAQRRKRVRMIEAGSILAAPVPVTGRIVDVCPAYDLPGAPDHPVYRSGIALTIGVPGGL